jgi:hypothetical protein
MSAPSSPRKQFDAPFAEPKPSLVPSNSSNSLNSMRSSPRRKTALLAEEKIREQMVAEANEPNEPTEAITGFPVERRMRRKAFVDAENKIRVILQETESETESEAVSEAEAESESASEISTPEYSTCVRQRRKEFPVKDCPHPRALVERAPIEAPKPQEPNVYVYPNLVNFILICTILFVVFGEMTAWYSKRCICL